MGIDAKRIERGQFQAAAVADFRADSAKRDLLQSGVGQVFEEAAVLPAVSVEKLMVFIWRRGVGDVSGRFCETECFVINLGRGSGVLRTETTPDRLTFPPSLRQLRPAVAARRRVVSDCGLLQAAIAL